MRWFQKMVSVAWIVDPVVREPVVLNDRKTIPLSTQRWMGERKCSAPRPDFYEPGVIEFCRKHGISVMSDVELLRSL